MRANLAAFASGVLFAAGLAIAGMTQPSKVVGFLDFFGDWDPSLMMVMGGAIAVHFALFRLVLKRKSPMFSEAFRIPNQRDLSPQLIGGAALFGIGWGLGGFCPGPGLASIATFGAHALTFVGTMALGIVVHDWIASRRGGSSDPNPTC